MHLTLALVAMVAWGGSSIFAAQGARASTALAVTVWSQVMGLLVGLPVLLLVAGSGFTTSEFIHGAIAGSGSGVALLLLYHSSRTIFAGVASAMSAVMACVIPVAYAAFHSTTSPREIVGAAVCLIALAGVGAWHREEAIALPAAGALAEVDTPGLAALEEAPDDAGVGPRWHLGGITTALLSGVGMSVYYIALPGSSAQSQVHSAFESRLVALGVLSVIALVTTPRTLVPTRPNLLVGLTVGATGIAGTLAYAGAVTSANLAVVVPLVSLSPAVTIILGRIFLQEATSRRETIGLIFAMVGVIIVTS